MEQIRLVLFSIDDGRAFVASRKKLIIFSNILLVIYSKIYASMVLILWDEILISREMRWGLVQYRSKVSWQSLEPRSSSLETRYSILDNFEYRVSSLEDRVSSLEYRVSSRES